MRRIVPILLIIILAMAIAACDGEDPTPTPAPTAVPEEPTAVPPTEEPTAVPTEVTGEIVYRERIALPDDAVVQVQIQNISLADAPAEVIGEQTYVTEGKQVPLPFAVPYNPADIEENMMYGLSVRIEAADGTLLFINDTAIPVITNGNPTSDIVADVIMVGSAEPVEDTSQEVTGEIVYRERIALPDDAVVSVQIQNISLADAPAQVIGEQTYVTEGKQVPLPFAVPYNPADIEENIMYGLSIRIEAADGTLLFINDTAIPVITNGNPTSGIVAEVIMVNAPAGGEEASMVDDENVIAIDPSMVSIDTQGLPYAHQTVYVPETPYDESMPPGPKGLPAHIEILFGITDPADRNPGDPTMPIMYIIPVKEYEAMWEANGNDSVTNTMNNIAMQTYLLPQPASTTGMPLLPKEELGANFSVQVGRAVSLDQQTDEMATKNGYRFVGRFTQDVNPVTNQGLRYIYQGFTNDGAYHVSFFYPVRTDQLPDDGSSLSQEEMQAVYDNPQPYMEEQAEILNGLSTSDWQPDLATLDAVVQSLKITETPANGLVNKTFQWTGEVVNPSTGDVTTNELGEAEYSLTFNSDGTFSGVLDCNNIAGSYTIDGGIVGGIVFQPGPSTAAFCGEESKDVTMQNLLAATQNYRVAPGGNKMDLIMPAGGGDYAFEAVPPQVAIVTESPGPIERVVGRQLQWITFFDTVEGEISIEDPELYQMILNEDGTVDVVADCKQTEGTYTADGSNIKIELGPVTMQICSEESLADQYLGYLSNIVIFFNRDGDVYFDLMADSGTMQFTDAAGSETIATGSGAEAGSADAGLPEELFSTTWQWVGFSDPANGSLEIPNPENYLLDLQEDGSFLVKADCNNGSGIYTVDGGSISFVMGPLTRAFCGEESLDTQYLQNLEAAAIWFTESGDLYFDLKFDSGTMQFSPAAESMVDETEAPASENSSESEDVSDATIQLDLQGLADFYTWEVVPGYPPSPGPGGIGSSAYVAVLFNGATLTETQLNKGPVIYIYPTEAYINVAGQSVVAQVEQVVSLLELADGVTPEPDTWMPLLPPPGSLMDRWVQYLKLDFTQGQGVRYISDSPYRQQMGVWANETTSYYYQALTEDGSFYISMSWPVSTESLPNTADEADEGVKAEATNPETSPAYQAAIRTMLNDLSASDWSPSLDDLDALAASIQFQP